MAGKLNEFGIELHPGDVVLSGSFIRAPWISPGSCRSNNMNKRWPRSSGSATVSSRNANWILCWRAS